MLELFEVHMSVAELVIRGSAIFWFLFLVFRFVMRRGIGGVGVGEALRAGPAPAPGGRRRDERHKARGGERRYRPDSARDRL
jgi:hypothetical protein